MYLRSARRHHGMQVDTWIFISIDFLSLNWPELSLLFCCFMNAIWFLSFALYFSFSPETERQHNLLKNVVDVESGCFALQMWCKKTIDNLGWNCNNQGQMCWFLLGKTLNIDFFFLPYVNSLNISVTSGVPLFAIHGTAAASSPVRCDSPRLCCRSHQHPVPSAEVSEWCDCGSTSLCIWTSWTEEKGSGGSRDHILNTALKFHVDAQILNYFPMR